MISVSAIIALRNLPLMAYQGFSSVFFFLTSAVLFFIPVALVCAELASGWPKDGGIYAWVKEAFGESAGALAIWFEWMESVVWLPAVLSFIAATTAYIINPLLAENRYFLLSIMLIVLWGGTFLNFLGMKTSGWVSSGGIILGSLIPGIVIISLGVYWVLSGHPLQVEFSVKALFPDFSLGTLVFFTSILLGFAGMEVAAFHAVNAKNPKTTYPRASFISAFLIITVYTLGALAIAVVVPRDQISLSAGLMQGFSGFFQAFNSGFMTPIMAILTVIGALALVNTWLIGPSRGLLVSAKNGNLPHFACRTNPKGVPIAILISQACISTALTLVFLFMPSTNSAYWLLTVLAAQFIIVMYFLVFISAIRLRYTHAHVPRHYRIPGGLTGIWVIAGTGALACVFAFFIGFVPPEEFDFGSGSRYSLILLTGLLLFSLPPIVCHFQNEREKKKS